MVDASKYAGTRFIKLEDVENGPFTLTIMAVEEDSKFDKLNLVLDDGRKFSVNKTNCGTLVRAFGKDTNNWIDREVEFYRGPLHYQGNERDGVLVRALDGEAIEATNPRPKPKPKPKADYDDGVEIRD